MALFPVYYRKKQEMALFLFQEKYIYIYSINMRTNRNELIRRLLSGVTTEELEYLVKLREEARSSIHPVEMLGGEARRPIPAPRKIVTQYKPIPVSRLPVPAPRTIIIWNHTR